MNKTNNPTAGRGFGILKLWRVGLPALVVLASIVIAIETYRDRENQSAHEPLAATAPSDVERAPATSRTHDVAVTAKVDTPFQHEKVRTPDPYHGSYNGVTNIGERFHVDAKGRLVQNEKTRLHLDALVTLLEPDTLYNVVEHEVRDLPPEAAAQVRELVERYKTYIQDQDNLIPPGETPLTDDEALAQLDALRDLRIAHFGKQTAEAMYGEEMKNARALIRLEQGKN